MPINHPSYLSSSIDSGRSFVVLHTNSSSGVFRSSNRIKPSVMQEQRKHSSQASVSIAVQGGRQNRVDSIREFRWRWQTETIGLRRLFRWGMLPNGPQGYGLPFETQGYEMRMPEYLVFEVGKLVTLVHKNSCCRNYHRTLTQKSSSMAKNLGLSSSSRWLACLIVVFSAFAS